MGNWRFIDTGINNGFFNMAIDEAILDTHIRRRCPPTLRVYRWSPPTLSLGYFQSMEREIDEKRCSELGIDIVRRQTGGRAVLHHNELTYSIVTSEAYGFPKSIMESYRLLSEGLIAAYQILGLEVCLEDHTREPSSAACFTGAGLADLAFHGRKLCGSAQFRRGDALLQHGSLPIELDANLLFCILRYPSTAIRDKAQADFSHKAAGISEFFGNNIGWQQLKEALLKGFQTSLGIEFYDDNLTAEEIVLSQRLTEEKYLSMDWNYHGKYETSLVDQTTAIR